MSSLKINFTLAIKAIRIIEKHIVANFSLDSRAKKVRLTIKLTKQESLYRINYIQS